MEFNIDIQGYYRDVSKELFPNIAGIYFVYRGFFVPHLKTVTLKALLYIGESADIGSRLKNHERRDDFLSSLQSEEELFYSFSNTENLSDKQRKRIEAALIYELCPPLNSSSTETFEYDTTIIHVHGDRHAYIPTTIEAPSY